MIICQERKTVIWTAPKTGSTSLHKMAEAEPNRFQVRLSSNGYHDCGLPEQIKAEWNQWRIIATIRTPLTRIVSLWKHHNRVHGSVTFPQFVEQTHKRTNQIIYHRTLSDWYGSVDIVDDVIAFESFNEDVARLMLFREPIRHDNQSKPSGVVHTKETIRLTREWASEDCAFYLRFGQRVGPMACMIPK